MRTIVSPFAAMASGRLCANAGAIAAADTTAAENQIRQFIMSTPHVHAARDSHPSSTPLGRLCHRLLEVLIYLVEEPGGGEPLLICAHQKREVLDLLLDLHPGAEHLA